MPASKPKNSVNRLQPISVQGDEDLIRALRELGPRVEKRQVLNALRDGARLIRDRARELAPFRTGALRSKITIKSPAARPGIVVVSIGVGRGPAPAKYLKKIQPGQLGKTGQIIPSRYAHLPEFGAKHMKERPFLRTAIDERRDAVPGVVAARLRRGIAEEAAKLRAGG